MTAGRTGPAPPRHVLMTADAVGGVWTYALDLAEGLAREGAAVTLAVLGPAPSPAQRAAAAGLSGVALVETGRTLDWMEDDPEGLAETARTVAALARAVQADLVHLNSPILAADALFDATVVGACHSCLATWWDAVRGDGLPPSFRWRTERLGRGYRRCARLLAPSRSFAEATARRHGVHPDVVFNGRAGRASSRPKAEKPVALTSGRLWDEGKGFAALDRAAGLSRVPVRAAGALQGPNGQRVTARSVFPLGQLSTARLERELEAATAFVSLALYEPFGLGVLEAAQAGCALLLSDIPTFRELWEGAALFVPARDAERAAKALDELAEAPAEAARLGARARERAKRFSREAAVAGTLAVYREALAGAAPGAGAGNAAA